MDLLPTILRITTSPLLAILLCWTILSLSLPPLFMVAAAFTATTSTATRSFGKDIKNYKTNKMCPREAIKRNNCLAMSEEEEDSYDFKKFTNRVS